MRKKKFVPSLVFAHRIGLVFEEGQNSTIVCTNARKCVGKRERTDEEKRREGVRKVQYVDRYGVATVSRID